MTPVSSAGILHSSICPVMNYDMVSQSIFYGGPNIKQICIQRPIHVQGVDLGTVFGTPMYISLQEVSRITKELQTLCYAMLIINSNSPFVHGGPSKLIQIWPNNFPFSRSHRQANVELPKP
jgi:hypothetical protein